MGSDNSACLYETRASAQADDKSRYEMIWDRTSDGKLSRWGVVDWLSSFRVSLGQVRNFRAAHPLIPWPFPSFYKSISFLLSVPYLRKLRSAGVWSTDRVEEMEG